MMNVIHERLFTLKDQNNFAKLSGDYNKMHVDKIAARRYIFGTPVVHGIHILLWALDKWFENYNQPSELTSLKVSFQKPLPIGENIKSRVKKGDKDYIELELFSDDKVYAVVQVVWRYVSNQNQIINFNNSFPKIRDCRVWIAQDLAKAAGELDLCIEKELSFNLFPSLVKNLPLIQIAELLSTTRLVGMECPGFNSVFFELDVNFDSIQSLSASSYLKYKVVKFDSKFSLSVITVEGPSMRGNIKAFLRPVPCQQVNFSKICEIVVKGEFRDQRAMIIGGSRGLGEVVSKLLAAGGAEILLTYFKGYQDAQNVADDIISGCGNASTVFFDVLNPVDTLINKVAEFSPTHLYYFATPFITGAKGAFSTKMFRKFCDYYVSGFYNTMKFLKGYSPNLKKVFYPSSIFVEELPASLCEYSIAKSAGEVLCSFLEKTKNISIYIPRLPKMATDQTVSFIPNTNNDPVPILLKELKHFKSIISKEEISL